MARITVEISPMETVMSSLAVASFSLSSIVAALPHGWDWVQFFKWVVIVAAVVAIVVIALRAMKVEVPEWARQMFWVVVIAAVAILCIYVLANL